MVTLRDHTELQAVTGELDVVRGLTESLRSQTHEAANRLHTVVSLIEMGRPDDAVEFATEELAVAQQLTDQVVGAVGDPVLAALLLGKTAAGRRARHRPDIDGDLPARRRRLRRADLVTVVGNLVDNAIDAVAGRDQRRVAVKLERRRRRAPRRGRRQRPGLDPEDGQAVLGARLVHQGRPATAGAGSGWRWSARWPVGTAARSRSATRRSAAPSSRSRCGHRRRRVEPT